MGTHGWTGLDRVLLGCVTERVAHATACPLLVVPAHEPVRVATGVALSRILCAVDFRPSSLAGLRYALSLAQEGRARLELVTVLERPHRGEPRLAGEPDAAANEYARRQALRDALHKRVPDDARQWCLVHEEVLVGSPADALLAYAGDVQAELIVIGTGDRFHAHSLWLGSTTGRLMRSARCPLLIVPGPRQPALAFAKPLPLRDWGAELDRFSLTHQGEPATIAIMTEELGTQPAVSGLPLIGVTADRRDGTAEVAVILEKADGTRLTHVVAHPEEIRLRKVHDPGDAELFIVGRDGTTTLLGVGADRA
jgi:nucleotide-binding universal stress UspA family protein